MNIEQRLQSARHAIARHTGRLHAFQTGAVTPDIGELIGTQRLLKRAERKLRTLEIMRMTLPQNVNAVKVAHDAYPFPVDFA